MARADEYKKAMDEDKKEIAKARADGEKVRQSEQYQNAVKSQNKNRKSSTTSTKSTSKSRKESHQEELADFRNSDYYKQKVKSSQEKSALKDETKKAEKALEDYRNSDVYKEKQRKATEEQRKRLAEQGVDSVSEYARQVKPEDDTEKELQAQIDYWKRQEQQAEDRAIMDLDSIEYNTWWSDQDREDLAAVMVTETSDIKNPDNIRMHRQRWQAQQRLEEKYGQKRVKEMAETIRRIENIGKAQRVQEQAVSEADAGFLSAAGASVKSLDAGLGSAVMGIPYMAQEVLFNRTGRYNTLDPYNEGNLGNVYSGAVRGAVSENIEQELPGWGGKALSTIYQGGMSAADSAARLAAAGFNPTVAAALAASSTFTQTVADASAKGATEGQALLMGAAGAAVEGLSEKLPLDKLVKIGSSGKQGVKQAIIDVLGQVGTEVLEEEASLVGTMIAEAAFLREKSSYSQQIQDLVANGMSYEQAVAQTDQSVIQEAIQTAVVSGVSGGISGLGAVGTRAIAGASPSVEAEVLQEPVTAPQNAETEIPGQIPMEEIAPVPAAPAPDLVDTMVESARGSESGNISNSMAGRILSDPQAVARLEAEAGLNLEGLTRSQQRQAVKLAVKSLTGNEASVNVETPVAEPTTVPEAQTEQGAMPETPEQQQVSLRELTDGAVEFLNKPEQPARPIDPAAMDAALDEEFGVKPKAQPQKGEQLEDSSIEMKRDFEDYPYNAQTVMDDYVNSVDQNIVNFVEEVKSGAAWKGKRITVGNVNGRMAADIQMLTGVQNKEGNQIILNTDAVNHIENRHGASGEHDHTMKDAADIGRINYVLQNYDNCTIGDGNSYGYKNKDNSPADTVLFSKKINGTYFVVEAVPDTSKTWIVSAYIDEKGVPQVPDAKSPKGDVRNELTPTPIGVPRVSDAKAPKDNVRNEAGPAPNNNILSYLPNVNTNSENDSARTGWAEVDPDYTQRYSALMEDGNVQPSRATDVRPMEVPKADEQGRDVSQFTANVFSAEVTPDSFVPTIQKMVVEGKASHDVQSNEQTLKDAANGISHRGLIRSVDDLRSVAKKGRVSATDVAKGELLLNYLSNSDSQEAQALAADVFVSMTEIATASGRALQAFNMFRKLNSYGQMEVLRGNIERSIQNAQRSGTVKKDYVPNVDSVLLEDYRKVADKRNRAKSPDEIRNLESEMRDIENTIYQTEAAKLPVTFKAKWDAWRYMSMLGNVKTQLRNVIGQATMMPYTGAKRALNTLAERIFVKDKSKRRTALLGTSQEDQALKRWVSSDAKSDNVGKYLKSSANLGDSISQDQLSDNMRIFNSSALEGFRKLTNAATQGGDLLFKNREYTMSLAGFLKARGYSAADIEAGKVSEAVLNEGREFAIQEALKATFNDTNVFSDFMSDLGKVPEQTKTGKDNPIAKIWNMGVQGVLPFRKTPANIVVRFTEYSPVGFVKGVWDAATKVRNGDMSAATAINELSAGLTGTAAMFLGFALANGVAGVKLTGSDVDEDEERQGHQKYALEFSINGQEYSLPIDWAAPANLPLFVGANIYEMMYGEGMDVGMSKFSAYLYATKNMLEPMLALSCLSSLNDILTNQYGQEGDTLYSIAADMATSYLMQAIPSILRQGYQAMQENKQMTFANSEDPNVRDLQRTAGNVPFVGEWLGLKTDVKNWRGESVDNGNIGERLFNAFINPGSLKKINADKVEVELERLNEIDPGSVTPPTFSKEVTFINEHGEAESVRLTKEEYQRLQEVQGTSAAKGIEELMTSDSYEGMSDDEKIKAINEVWEKAQDAGRAALTDYSSFSKESRDEMFRLHEATGDGDVFYDPPSNSVTYTDKSGDEISRKLTDQEYEKYRRQEKDTFDRVLDQLQIDENYMAMDDDGKATAVKAAKEYAAFVSKSGAIDEYWQDPDDWTYKALSEVKKFATTPAKYIGQMIQEQRYNSRVSEFEKDLERRFSTKESSAALDQAYTDFTNLPEFSQDYIMENAEGDALKYLVGREDGISHTNMASAIEAVGAVTGTGTVNEKTGVATVRDIDRRGAIANLNVSDAVIDKLMKVWMSDEGTTELKYDAVRDMGYSPEEYVEVYRAYLDNPNKATKIAAIMEVADCDWGTANKLRKLFGGTYKPWEQTW